MVSVVIPVYNEQAALEKNAGAFQALSRSAEVVIADGGSSDLTREAGGKFACVVGCAKGRASQMNCGAARAQGSVLLFLHADCVVSPAALDAVEREAGKPGIVGGCLTQRIDRPGPLFRAIEAAGNFRANATRVFYGDQGIFVRREVFRRMGGFPEVPVMEDVLFTRALRRQGKTRVLRDTVSVSGRRWEQQGVVKTGFLYALMNTMFWLGVPLARIRAVYDDVR